MAYPSQRAAWPQGKKRNHGSEIFNSGIPFIVISKKVIENEDKFYVQFAP